MPIGVYQRTEKHSFNKGKKHPNRKRYFKGITKTEKICPFCQSTFMVDCKSPDKKYCSRSCGSKDHIETHLANLRKVDREKQKQVASTIRGEKHPRWIKDRTQLKDDSKRPWRLSA